MGSEKKDFSLFQQIKFENFLLTFGRINEKNNNRMLSNAYADQEYYRLQIEKFQSIAFHDIQQRNSQIL